MPRTATGFPTAMPRYTGFAAEPQPDGSGADLAAVATAAQIFASGLSATWAAQPPAGRPRAEAPDRATLVASIVTRANVLALRATIEAGRAGAAGHGFANAAGSIRALMAIKIRAAKAIQRHLASLRSSAGEGDALRSSGMEVPSQATTAAVAALRPTAA